MTGKKRLATTIGMAAIMAALFLPASAQQGWSRVQTIKRGDKPAVINAVFYDGDNIWVAGGEGLVARSFDEGRTFQEVSAGVTDGLNDIYVRGDRICIVGDGGVIVRSTDGGHSFMKSYYTSRSRGAGDPQTDGGAIDLYSTQFADRDNAYIVGDKGLILASTNGGLSWREQRSGTDAQLFHLSFQGERGWVVGTGGVILHTDDAGRNWYPQRSGTTDDLNRVYLINDRVGLITGDKGLLLRTENSGATWERVALNVREPLFGMSFIDKKTGWVVGYQGRIIRTYDGGRNWVEQDSGTTGDLFSVSFYKNRGYAIGRDGLVMRYYERR
ncbi:MAG TPA: YCF48-related protein [Blastocatellia bacterium]|nr:YCF48-related protein [Blastocatellia bacterium]